MTVKTKTPIGTIDCTPSWAGLLGPLLAAVREGGDKAKAALAELRHMAHVADLALTYQLRLEAIQATAHDLDQTGDSEDKRFETLERMTGLNGQALKEAAAEAEFRGRDYAAILHTRRRR